MAPPTSYTETTFKTYLLAALGAVGTAFGWTTSSTQVVEAMNDALLAYGASDVTTVTTAANIQKLRTLGRREIWRAAAAEVSGDYDVENEAGKMNRSQQEAMIRRRFAEASSDAMVYDVPYNVESETVDYNDPYLPAKLTESDF